jgi:hypothetical protein
MAKQKEEILFEWVCPKEASVLVAKEKFKQGKIMFPRVFVTIGIVWGALYFALDYLLPPDSGVNFGKLFILGFVYASLMLVVSYFGIPIVGMFSRIKYKITPERLYVSMSRSESRAIRWKDIVGYKACNYEEFEGFPGVIIFYHKGQFKKSICLPKDERADRIINYIAGRIPPLEKIPESVEIIKLSVFEKILLCVITGLYSLCASVFFIFYGHKWVLLIWSVPFLGPGTIYLASIYGRRFLSNKGLQRCALVFNSASVVLIILLNFWLMLWQMKREYSW